MTRRDSLRKISTVIIVEMIPLHILYQDSFCDVPCSIVLRHNYSPLHAIELEEIIDVVEKSKPELLTMSISHKFDLVTSEKLLNSLRKKIDKKTKIVIGGKGSPCTVQGVSYFHTFEKYYDYLMSLVSADCSEKSINHLI